jgi:alpha-galactosidase
MRVFRIGKVARLAVLLASAAAGLSAQTSTLTGNWAVKTPRADGTISKVYFNLKQDGAKILGTVRSTQFFYTITDSTGGPDGFTLTASMKDGSSNRSVKYEGKLVGDELRLSTRRRPEDKPTETVARRVADGEGAMPPKLPLPQIRKVPYNGLAKTPPMGWNSWNLFKGRVNDEIVRGIADAMVTSGMRDAGFVYVNIDDTWEGEQRDAQGNITTNSKFPDMKALADYVHSKGLKLGIYTSPGPNTCAGYEGTYGHEDQDARTFAAWGIDYVKYDWCGARTLYTDEDMPAVYQKFGEALQKTGRPIVYSLCQYGRLDVWKWGPDVGGNLWRTTGDIGDRWDSMTRIGFGQSDLAQFAKPGHWNDPDMLEVGNGGMTADEYRTHMSLWSILAAPLLAGNDIRNMTAETKSILMNPEVIAVDQDKTGLQGKRIWQSSDQEIWLRELTDGQRAIALFNRGGAAAEISLKWADVGLKKTPKTVRDLWAHADIKTDGPEYKVSVPMHGVVFLRINK